MSADPFMYDRQLAYDTVLADLVERCGIDAETDPVRTADVGMIMQKLTDGECSPKIARAYLWVGYAVVNAAGSAEKTPDSEGGHYSIPDFNKKEEA
jgi:hypothetical protein